jgi:hypothetical protein
MISDLRERGASDASVSGETIYTVLAGAARRASERVLVVILVNCLFAAESVLLVRTGRWQAVLPLICIASFGTWGIADRMRSASGPAGWVSRLVRGASLVAGTTAAVGTLVVIMALALGTWIS